MLTCADSPASGSVTPAVAAGANHTLALKGDGTAWTWGVNEHGQLGDDTITTRLTPVQVSILTGVTAIAAGLGHTIALKADGTIWTWGMNEYGQLWDGTYTDKHIPVNVKFINPAVSSLNNFVFSLIRIIGQMFIGR
ncbi:MAG: hypothetical protein HQK89_08455 [Nitrospirae bacterium]|nr:hypothetical protein [Nitrospirota bacterium]